MTEDEADKMVATMFDELVRTKIENGKVRVEAEVLSPSAEDEMREAADDFVRCERRFRKLNERLGAATDPGRRGVLWWREAEWLMLADNRLKDAFCGRDRSRESMALYQKYRVMLISGRRLDRTDA